MEEITGKMSGSILSGQVCGGQYKIGVLHGIKPHNAPMLQIGGQEGLLGQHQSGGMVWITGRKMRNKNG